MIKNVFLPQAYGSYYVFSSRIVGIEINAAEVIAVQVRARGTKRVIERTLVEPLEADTTVESTQRIANALTRLFEKLDKPDSVIVTLPSSHIVFKRLSVPFTEHEKIKKIIGFEVEPLLPFSLSNAVVDFVITQIATDKSHAEVLVAAAQKSSIVDYLSPFKLAGIPVEKVTVDIIGLHAMTQSIPDYAHTNANIVLLSIGTSVTTIAYVHQGTLTHVRTIPRGTTYVAKALSQEHTITAEAALEELLRFGIEKTDDPAFGKAAHKVLSDYFERIAFTIQSFSEEKDTVQSILMFGPGSHIQGIVAFAHDALHTQCQLFKPQRVLEDKTISLKAHTTLDYTYSGALSAALPFASLAHFNMRPIDLGVADTSLFFKQLIVATILSCSVIGALGVHYYLQRRAFKKDIALSEKEVVDILKERFNQIDSKAVASVVEDAEEEVSKEEKTWFAFSNAARASMLTLLLELKNTIDKESLGLNIEKLTITEGEIVLKAQVRDYNALKLLEQALRTSELLKNFEPQTDPSFEMKITLPLPTREGE